MHPKIPSWPSSPKEIARAVAPAVPGATRKDNVVHRQVLSRLFFSMMTMIVVLMGFLSPETITHYMIVHGGLAAIASSVVLFGASSLAFLDALVNDILPPRFSFFFDRRYRYAVWCVIGITHISYALIFVKLHYSVGAAVLYTLFGVWASAIGTMDVVYEYNERNQKNASH